MRLRPRAAAWILLFALVLFAGACSILDSENSRIRVLNQTEGAILFFAWELQASHLVDPAPSVQITLPDDRILSPGASRTLRPSEISGEYESGDDLRLFLYEVLGGTAEYRTALTVSAEDLREADHRVRIEGFSQ